MKNNKETENQDLNKTSETVVPHLVTVKTEIFEDQDEAIINPSMIIKAKI